MRWLEKSKETLVASVCKVMEDGYLVGPGLRLWLGLGTKLWQGILIWKVELIYYVSAEWESLLIFGRSQWMDAHQDRRASFGLDLAYNL